MEPSPPARELAGAAFGDLLTDQPEPAAER